MSKIEIYLIFMILLENGIRVFLMGKGGVESESRTPTQLFFHGIIATTLALPIWGRVFGWW